MVTGTCLDCFVATSSYMLIKHSKDKNEELVA